MHLSIADVKADETLPTWMADERFPDWSRHTKYRNITEGEFCVALIEVRRGLRDQRSFDRLISSRKSTAKVRAEKRAAHDALSPKEKVAQERQRKQQQRLARLRSVVTMRERMLSEAVAKYGEQGGLFLEGNQLKQARASLDRHVIGAIAEEFRRHA